MANNGCRTTACMVVAKTLGGGLPGTENNRRYVVVIQYRCAVLLMIKLYSKPLWSAAIRPFAIARSHKIMDRAQAQNDEAHGGARDIRGGPGEVVQRSKSAPHLGGGTNAVHNGAVRE